MKIALISPLNKRTGISKYSYTLCMALRQQGIDVDLIYQSAPENLFAIQEDGFVKYCTTVDFIKNVNHYDILHFQSGNSKFHHFQNHFLFLANFFLKRKFEIIATMHDGSFNCMIKAADCRLCKLICRCVKINHTVFGSGNSDNFISKFLYQKSTCVIAHSCGMKKLLQDAFGTNKKYYVIKHIGYLADFCWKRYNTLDRSTALNILIPGHIHENKAIDTTVRALANIIKYKGLNFKATFMGKIANEKYSRYILDLIEQYGLYDRIKIAGFVPESTFIKNFLDADIIVISRRDVAFETSGMLIHALSSGTPVIVPEDGSFTEYVQEGYGIFYRRGDSSSLENAIQKLIMNKKLRGEMSKKELTYAREQLNEKRVAQKHIEVYKEILDRRKD